MIRDSDDAPARTVAYAIPMTGGKYYNVRRTTDLEQALTDSNEVDKGAVTRCR